MGECCTICGDEFGWSELESETCNFGEDHSYCKKCWKIANKEGVFNR